MAQVVLNIATETELVRPILQLIQGSPRAEKMVSAKSSIVLPAIILGLVQILDGILTWFGIIQFRASAEGNLFIRFLIENFGATASLVFVKLLALIVIYFLCKLAVKVCWVPAAMKAVIAVYLFAAIIPWTFIHLTNAI